MKLQFHSSFWVTYTLSSHDKKRQIALESTNDVPRIVFDLTPVMAERLERTSRSRYRWGLRRTSGHRIKNWSLSSDAVDNAMEFAEPLSSITLVIVALVYGGLHLLAWNAPFHTRVEETLWKISGISVASIGPMSFAYVGLLSVTEMFFRHTRGKWHSRRSRLVPIENETPIEIQPVPECKRGHRRENYPGSWCKLLALLPFRKSLPRRRMLHRSGISPRLRLHHSGLYTLHPTSWLGLSYGGETSRRVREQGI